jgi:predicted nucleotidyltransferase component of viral defense system
MILQKEIITLAEQLGVAKSMVEKDWVLGHFIAAIYSQPELSECLVFKGGTCLKKCWIPDYRFSEDLDFTSINPEFILTRKHVKAITDYLWLNERIQTHLESISSLKFNDQLTGYEAKIKYWGADHPANAAPPVHERWSTSIKIKIIL